MAAKKTSNVLMEPSLLACHSAPERAGSLVGGVAMLIPMRQAH
jgi:hypothetical protein